MKFIWIITLALCANYKSKCYKDCDVSVDHTHIVQVCRDSSVAFKEKKDVIEFYKTHFQTVKRIDSVQVK